MGDLSVTEMGKKCFGILVQGPSLRATVAFQLCIATCGNSYAQALASKYCQSI